MFDGIANGKIAFEHGEPERVRGTLPLEQTLRTLLG